MNNQRDKILTNGAFWAYAIICSIFLYINEAPDVPLWIYLRSAFPVGLLLIYKGCIEKKSDEEVAMVIGKTVIFVCIPAVFLTIGMTVIRAYLWVGSLYRKLGMPESISFLLMILSPPVLTVLIVWIVYRDRDLIKTKK
jgi:hypothetical protein